MAIEINEKKAFTWEIPDAFIIPPFCRAHSGGEVFEVVTNGTPVESLLWFFRSVKALFQEEGRLQLFLRNRLQNFDYFSILFDRVIPAVAIGKGSSYL